MKRIILCLSLFAFFGSQAQQINPVPDYVFSNKMSVGRNAVTDTAAYFSIGPRYGAIRGMMPPMVTDTANMSATKRNGLLIFSIQKNKYLYWDSVGSKWAEMAGTAGSAITGSGVAGYMPEFTTATNLDTTRLYHSAGRFAIGSTTTTNGVFNVYSGQSYMDSTLKIGNGELIVGSTSSASRKLYVTSNSDVARFEQTASDKNMVIELRHTNPNASGTIREEGINFLAPNTATRGRITFYPSDTFNVRNYLAFFTPSGSGTTAERMRIANDGLVGIGTTNPLSQLEVNSTATRVRVVGTTGGAVNQYVTDGGQMFVGIDNSSASLFGNGAYSRIIYGGAAYPLDFYTNDLIRARITSAGELLINTTTDAGAYALQVAGSIYNTTGAVLAASSGEVLIGTTSDAGDYILQTNSGAIFRGNASSVSIFIPSGNAIRSDGNLYIDAASTGAGGLFMRNLNNGTQIGIYSNGNVGIGSVTPSYLLDVNGSFRSVSSTYLGTTSGAETYINTTTDAGTYALQVSGAIYNTTTITTGAPTSGSAKPWRLGEAATVSPTSPNRTIRVEIDGTVYYLHAKTTND